MVPKQRILALVVTTVVVVSLIGGLPVATAQQAEEEPNDSRDSAQPIEMGEEVTADLTADDTDWYAIQVEAGETVNLTVDGSNAVDGSINFQIRDPNNNLIRSDVRDGVDTLGTTMATGGTAYVRIVENGAPVEYSFTVESYRTDWFEPNEEQQNATHLYENPLPSKSAMAGIGDYEWFRFEVGADESITATGWSLSSETVSFKLFRPDGSTQANDVANGKLTLETTTATAGTAYFRPASHRGSPGSLYNVTVVREGERLGLPNDRFEIGNPPVGNQNRENAPDLTSGTYALAIVDDDRDVFTVDLAEGERVRAAIEFSHDENDLALALTDEAGTEVESADSGTDDEQLAFTAPSGGTYYLQVSGEAGAATTYDLDLAVLERTDVTIGPGGLTAPPDTTTTVNVSVTGASAGLSNTNLSLRSTDTSVLRIESIDAVGEESVSSSVADDGGSATATISGLDQTARGTETVAEVTVTTVGNGSATLDGEGSVAARPRLDYPLGSVQGTSVTVAPGEEVSTATRGSSDGEGESGDGGAADGADGAGDGAESGAESGDGATNGATTGGGSPGFGVVGALLALAVTALLARRR